MKYVDPVIHTRETHVLFLSAEADPLVKMGGLGDVSGSLPKALMPADPRLDIRLVIPHYQCVNPNYPLKSIGSFAIPSKSGPVDVDVSFTEVDGLKVYLLGGKPLHAEESVYPKNTSTLTERFVFFSIACIHLPSFIKWPVDILHANDWHTALALHVLQQQGFLQPELANTRTILTIHNLPFMGSGSEAALELFMVKPAENKALPVWARTIPLPMGLNAADKIVPVSEGYAREILSPDYGCNLQDFLQTKSNRIKGIVNGIDYSIWDPKTDAEIAEKYSFTTINNRQINKRELQTELSLAKGPGIPLFSVIGRLDQQKGMDVIIECFSQLHHANWQLIVLAYGNDENLRSGLLNLQQKHPDNVRFVEELNLGLSRRIYSAADMLLMPSRYEPCGLAQMIAMHYGCIPIATATGGLRDTIRDYSFDQETATGFLSQIPNSEEFLKQINLAIMTLSDQKAWLNIQKNAMKADFSWKKPALQYLALYNELLQ